MTLGDVPFVILMPVYDDWESVRLLLPLVDEALVRDKLIARVLLIDDGSRVECPPDLVTHPMRSVREVAVLVLRRKLGHRARSASPSA